LEFLEGIVLTVSILGNDESSPHPTFRKQFQLRRHRGFLIDSNTVGPGFPLNNFGEKLFRIFMSPTKPGFHLPGAPYAAGSFFDNVTVSDFQQTKLIPGLTRRVRSQKNLPDNVRLPFGADQGRLRLDVLVLFMYWGEGKGAERISMVYKMHLIVRIMRTRGYRVISIRAMKNFRPKLTMTFIARTSQLMMSARGIVLEISFSINLIFQ